MPEPTRTTAPTNSLLAQEVSAVTYNPDTNTLFVVGDGGTSIVQVSKTGQLINSMTLAPGNSPQGTTFYDLEGLAYIGGGKFVMTEERDRQLVQFTYVAGSTLTRSATQTVKIGTTIGNIGLEGVTYDPITGGYIVVKETQPEGIFQTGVSFATGIATNGSPTTENSVNLFDPAKLGLSDFADVFALSNVSTLTGSDSSHLLVLSQESGKIVNIDRSGNIYSTLTIKADSTDTISVADQSHEGVTLDNNGILYVTSENGGGDINRPQLWVYAPTIAVAANQAPTAVLLNNALTTIAQTTNTAAAIKVADIAITDDGKGTNNLSISGADASAFEISGTGLFLKAGTLLNSTTKSSYNVVVNVDDPTIGTTPDASRAFTLGVTSAAIVPSALIISEVSPWSSGNSPYGADWFEVTNTGKTAVNLTGWKMDDNSNSFGSAVGLRGITSVAAGESVIFIEGAADGATDATIRANFSNTWFGTTTPPIGVRLGNYGGAGVGLSTAGDAVNLFDSTGSLITGISFGASTTGFTFEKAAGLSGNSFPTPVVSSLSVAGSKSGFRSPVSTETGSPGSIANFPIPTIRGGLGDDTLYGTNGSDRFLLGDGNNVAYGNGGNDLFFAGSGNDMLYGGTGNDTFDAGDGNNTLYGNGGTDIFVTGAGNDTIYGGMGNDTMNAGDGNNILFGNGGTDIFTTGSGNDTIYGGTGNDTMNAGGGNDILFGNGGTDVLNGGFGDDIIYAGGGINLIDGGSGNDTIWLNGGKDTVSLRRSEGLDTVNGFQEGKTQFSLGSVLRFTDLTFSQGNGLHYFISNFNLSISTEQSTSLDQ